jgi:predicted nucleotidyltransferase
MFQILLRERRSLLFDSLKLSVLPGDAWVRGAIMQGIDVRAPLGIEVIIKRQNIIARRME